MTDVVPFSLVGKRNYVRATDILRAADARFSNRLKHTEFLRPLRSDGKFVKGHHERASAVFRLTDGSTYSLLTVVGLTGHQSNDPAKTGLSINAAGRDIQASFRPLPLIGLIEKSFDALHPKMERRFVVVSVDVFAPLHTPKRLIWTRVIVSDDGAKTLYRDATGPLVEVRYRLFSRRY